MTSIERLATYGARNTRARCYHYDVILIVISFITELTTPSVTDERTLRTYGHLTAFNIGLHCVPEKRPPFYFSNNSVKN